MDQIFFNGWEGIFRVAVSTIAAYILVVIMLRISGKRTLAKMNAFDTIVTIALGSILATVTLSKSTPIAEGLTAIGLLILLQFIITYFTARSKTFKKVISSSPTLVFYKGQFLDEALKNQRVSKDEINKSVREAGFSGFDKVNAIIMESTGDITIITKSNDLTADAALHDVENLYR